MIRNGGYYSLWTIVRLQYGVLETDVHVYVILKRQRLQPKHCAVMIRGYSPADHFQKHRLGEPRFGNNLRFNPPIQNCNYYRS